MAKTVNLDNFPPRIFEKSEKTAGFYYVYTYLRSPTRILVQKSRWEWDFQTNTKIKQSKTRWFLTSMLILRVKTRYFCYVKIDTYRGLCVLSRSGQDFSFPKTIQLNASRHKSRFWNQPVRDHIERMNIVLVHTQTICGHVSLMLAMINWDLLILTDNVNEWLPLE